MPSGAKTPKPREYRAAAEKTATEKEEERKFDPGQKLEIDDEPNTEVAGERV